MPRICIIGAGPSGLAAAKNVITSGLAESLVIFEKSGEVGGNWVYREKPGHSSVYETTHIISSKTLSAYEDFPFPAGFPDYPSHKQLREYFESYAVNFDIPSRIRFHTEVTHAELDHTGVWKITSRGPRGKKVEYFDYLMVANGHHWDPAPPKYEGSFTGKFIHSHDYKRSEPFRGKRVLVVGGGNSAADIAVECSRVADRTTVSMRRGHWFLPKFMFGTPVDVLYHRSLWMPRAVRQWVLRLTLLVWQGNNRKYGMANPDYGILEGHPTVNSELLYAIRHGEIATKPGVSRLDGRTVHFTDGTSETFDVIIAATGYHISFPFFDKSFIDFKGRTEIPLWRKMFHGEIHNLYFIGLFQPLGCIWPLADFQAKLACLEIEGRYTRPSDITLRIEQEMRKPHFRFLKTPRHSTEVDYPAFRRELRREIRKAARIQ